ncbi:MAG: sugar ABC transporter permease [Lachnospiraceae bacterium]|nr:sugar ABC transporter permease [Lachnospiraceae bacterium]
MLFLPTLLLIVYSYVPMGGIIIAFQNYKPLMGFFKSEFVGLENFRQVFQSSQFGRAMVNTVIIAFWKIVWGLIVPVVFALMLNELRSTLGKRVAQTVVYLPHFVSWVLMAGIITNLFSLKGTVNMILGFFGVEPIFFLGDNDWFRFTLIITDIWKNFGWGTIVYMAALTGIDMNLYEAVAIDGGGRWQQTLHVTLPGIASTVILMMTLSLGNVLNAGFDQVFNLMNDVTMKSGDILDTLVYRLGMEQMNYSRSTAVGLFKSVVGAVMIVLSHKLADKAAGYSIF